MFSRGTISNSPTSLVPLLVRYLTLSNNLECELLKTGGGLLHGIHRADVRTSQFLTRGFFAKPGSCLMTSTCGVGLSYGLISEVRGLLLRNLS